MPLIAAVMVLSVDASACRAQIESVLSQSDRNVELLVAAVGASPDPELPADSRLRLMRAEVGCSMAELLRLAARESEAPFLLALAPGVSLNPGAFTALLGPILGDPAVQMTTGLLFSVGTASAHISRADWHTQWEKGRALWAFDPSGPDGYLTLDFLPSNPRLFRREGLVSILHSDPPPKSEFGLLWRAHALLETRVVFEPVGLLHSNRVSENGHALRVCRLLEERRALRVGFGAGGILAGAARRLWLDGPLALAKARFRVERRRWLLRSGLARGSYGALAGAFRNWPVPRTVKAGIAAGRRRRIGYYIWQFPVQSQTFVQREIAALLRAGEDVVIFTEAPAEDGFIAELEPWLSGIVVCLPAATTSALPSLREKFFRTAPLRYLGLRLFVLGHRLQVAKSRRADREIFQMALRLAEVARMRGVTHLHSPWADRCAAIALLASRMIGLGYSVQARAHDLHREDYRFGLREKFRAARFVITNTEYNVREIASLLGDDHRHRIRLIYNGLNLGQFEPPPPVARQDRGGAIRLLCVARLIEQKGLTYLLQAVRRLLDGGLALRCDIVGGFEDVFVNYYVELRKMHRRLGLEGQVRFAGPLPFHRVLDFYREADIFVLPCVIAADGSRDIIPNSVLEAMAMGLPVVATTVTGLPEIVDDRETGILVRPNDAAALASAIRRLAVAPELRSEFGRAGRLKVEKQFDSDRNVAGYLSAFGSLSAEPLEHVGPGEAR